jgi:amino acid adenylation domain-containing protein
MQRRAYLIGSENVAPPLRVCTSVPTTLVDLLRERAGAHPGRTACTFLLDGEEEGESLTYAALDREARRIASLLLEEGLQGERVLMLFPAGVAFVAAYFGCLYAGAVAVPVYPPRSNRNLDRLLAIVADAGAGAVLATGEVIASLAQHAGDAPQLAALRWIAAGAPGPGEAAWADPGVAPGDVAFLQYTSGSTSTPKGVRVTHANLLANQAMLRDAFGHREGLVVAGWLPLYHDMGLIGNVLHPLYMGGTCVLMAPTAFLQRPARWLEAVSRYGAETSGGPNFAYELCADRVSDEEKARLDLSTWRVAFCGSEPVRSRTLDRFAEAFAGCGFRRDAFYPCYGLAESTLFVTGGRSDEPPVVRAFRADALERDRALPGGAGDDGTASLVGCGFPWREGRVEIVRADTRTPCAPGEVGEIWVSGPHVAAGYWNRPDATDESFGATLASGAGPFLRTGDLGFVDGGELFVTGRAKDLLILRGRNLYPQDIEATAGASHPALQPGGGAAFSVEVDGEERLVVVHEVRRTAVRGLDAGEVARRIREEVAASHEAAVYAVVLIGPATLAKTSSGKVQRQACRRAYLAGSLDALGGSVLAAADAVPASEAADPAASPLEALLREEAARALGLSASAVRPGTTLTSLGLDSVGAARLAARLEERAGVRVEPVSLLEPRSVRELAADLASTVTEPAADTADGTTGGGEEPFPLSEGQRALWFLHRLAPESAAYNLAAAVRIRGPLDVAVLSAALDAVAARHGALRTVVDADEPVQRVLARPAALLAVRDAAGWSDDALRGELRAEASRPFRFADGPPVRFLVFGRGPDDHVLLLAAHHAVLDFRSLEIVFDELFHACAALASGTDAAFPAVAHQADFVRWQREMLAGEEGERLRARLVERLAGAPTVLALPTDRPRPPVRGHRGSAHVFTLSPGLSARLHELARAEGVTPYVLLLAAFQVLLHRWSGQDDFLVGSPASGRTRPGLAGIAGFLVNTVVLRARMGDDPSFRDLLRRTRDAALAALGAQGYPFERLVEQLHPERDASRTPLVQVLFVLQQADRLRAATACALGIDGAREERGGLALESLAVETGAAQFDLALAMGEVEGRLAGSLRYDADLFEPDTVRRMATHLERLLEGIAAAPETPVGRLPLLPPAETQRVVHGFNATEVRFAEGDALLHRLVEAQAARTPDAVAVVFGDEAVSYRDLDDRANRIARHLRGLGVGPEVRVGVCLERSVEMVAALLGVLKAGGAYLPVDPAHPAERIAYVLADADVPVLLTQERLTASLPEHRAATVRLDADWPAIAAGHAGPPEVEASPDGMAYVIYTSGSTGRPKGAMNAHRGVVNRLLWMQTEYGLGPEDVVLQKTPFSFDVSVWEFFWPLVTGARLVVARPEGHRDPAYLSRTIAEQGVTTLHFVPSMLRAFLEHGDARACGSVRRVFASGEALPAELAERFSAELPHAELHNLYGPTEAAVDVTSWRCAPGDARRAVPIGRPVANTRIHVLDRSGEPAPVGVPGELHIGGVQVGRGYLGRPPLTAEKFVPDALSAEPGARLYRTGDLARWRADGVLEYLGRTDDQVKVRGFRIEPGEIEAVLAMHPGVREALVVLREDAPGDPRLVAYFVAGGEAPPAQALRALALDRLPEHMVPSAFVRLDAIPLSPNGKVDRRALPAPDREAGAAAAYVAPRSEVEEALAAIWSEVLGVERVGVHDHFFELGGYSLLAVRVGSRVQETFGVDLPLHTLFEAPTVGALALRIARAQLESQPDDEMLQLLAELEAAGMAEE